MGSPGQQNQSTGKRVPVPFGGLYNSQHETKTPTDRSYWNLNCTTDKGVIEGIPRPVLQTSAPGASDSRTWGAGYGKWQANEVQKLVETGGPTGGTVVLQWNGQNTTTIAWNASAIDIQTALIALSNIDAGDVICTGGPLNIAPVYVTFEGQYVGAAQSLIVLHTNSLTGGTSPSIAISHWITGGSYEYFVVMMDYSLQGYCNLYTVSSNDGFRSNFTWTHVDSVHYDTSDWFFTQYQGAMYGVNKTNGLVVFPFGGTPQTQIGAPTSPSVPIQIQEQFTPITQRANVDFSTASSIVGTGFSVAPTISATSGPSSYLTITANASDTNIVGVITATWSSDQDYEFHDTGLVNAHEGSNPPDFAFSVGECDISLVDVNNVTTNAWQGWEDPAFTSTTAFNVNFTFASQNRQNRRHTRKIVITMKIAGTVNGQSLYFGMRFFQDWLNDTLTLALPNATQATINYAYSYFNNSTNQESLLSDPVTSGLCPPKGITGCLNNLIAPGDYQLTTSDLVYFYRQEKSTGLWRKLPNTDGTYGVANVTSGTVSLLDGYMENELSGFPTAPSTIPLFPENITTWKGSLVIDAQRQLWMSEVGAPLNFAHSPDSGIDQTAQLLLEGPGRAVTFYPSNSHGEQIFNVIGEDAFYCCTDKNTYATLADQPSDIIAMRQVRSSRGSIGHRAGTPYNGSLLVGTIYGFWLYRVSRMWSDVDGGNDTETELTQELRRSWQRLISPTFTVVFDSGVTGGTWQLDWKGQRTSNLNYNCTAKQIKDALEALSNMQVGDVDVVIDGLLPSGSTNTNGSGTTLGIVYIRFVQEWAGVAVGSTDLGAISALTGGTHGITVTAINAGGYADGTAWSLKAAQWKDEFWCWSADQYLTKTIMGKWFEGYVPGHGLQADVSTMQYGNMYFSGFGLYRIGAPQNSDQTRWIYQSGVNLSPRQRVLRIFAFCDGNPYVKIIRDDLAGGQSETCYGLTPGRNFILNVNQLPGVRHTVQFGGNITADKVHGCDLFVEDAGVGAGA